MPFEIQEAVWSTLTSITTRVEAHGDDDKVPAVSFGLAIACDRTFIAAHLGADVADSLFKELVTEQMPLEAVEPTWVLRAPSISIVSLDKKLEGWSVRIAHGIEDATSSELVFGSCKLDSFRVAPGLRESTIMFRVGTSDVDAVRLGELGMLLKQEIELTITAPKAAAPTIDASGDGDWPRGDEDGEAADLFAGGDNAEPTEGAEPEHEYTPLDALIDGDPAEPKPARRGRKRSTVAAE